MLGMADLLPLLVLAIVGLTAYAIFDCVTTDARMVRHLPKGPWIMLILLLPGLGAVMWCLRGRPTAATTAYHISGHPAGRGRVEAWGNQPAPAAESPSPRLVPPDDDPAFLADLALRAAEMREAEARSGRASEPRTGEPGPTDLGRTEERLRRWEADLRQREERLRQRGEPPIED
jgi:hypothetical protein